MPLTIRDAILTCNQKLTWVSLIYRTEPTTQKWKNRKKTKSKKRICSLTLSDIGFVSNSANRCRTLTSLGPRGHSFYDCTARRRSIALRRCVCVRNYLLPDTRLPSSAPPHTSLHPITSDHHLLTVYSRLVCSPRIWVTWSDDMIVNRK